MNSYLDVFRRFNRNTRLHLLTPIMIGFSYHGLFLVLFNLYLLRLGYDTRFIGIIGAAGTLCFIVMSLPAGALGRHWGSRRMVIVGLTLYMLGFSLIPFAELFPDVWRTPWLVSTFMIAFLGGPFYWVNSNLFLMASTRPTERNYAFAIRTALFPFAGVIGSLVGGVLPGTFSALMNTPLTEPAPYRYALFLSGLLYVPALLAMRATREVDYTPGVKPQKAGNLPYALIAPFVIVELLRMAGFVGTLGFFNVYLDEQLRVSTATIGIIAGAALLLSGIAALSTPVLAGRLTNRRTAKMAMLGMVLGLLILAGFQHLFMVVLGYVLVMALAAVSYSAISVYRMEIVKAAWWSTMSGAATMGQGVGESAILLAGGYLIAAHGFSNYYLMVASLVLAGALFFWLYFRKTSELPEPAPTEQVLS
jgi:MFS family permease